MKAWKFPRPLRPRGEPPLIDAEFQVVNARIGAEPEGSAPESIEDWVVALITLAVLLGAAFAAKACGWPWITGLTADDYAAAYGGATAVVGILGAIAIYIAAISQKGIVLGGTVGLIPSLIGGLIVAGGWPLILLVGIIWREPFGGGSVMGNWAADQFERR